MADLSALAPYANDPNVVAYLKALQAGGGPQQQAPANSYVPFDAGLTAANNAADLNYQNTLTAIESQQPLIQRRYGFTSAGDIDPSNPFGRAQLMKRSYDQSQRGTTTSYAARGQLYSGALQRRKDENQFDYQANDAALRGEYGQQLAGLSAQRAAAMSQLNTTKAQNYWGYIGQMAEDRRSGVGEFQPPPDVSGGGGGGGGGADPGLAAINNNVQQQAIQVGGAAAPQYGPGEVPGTRSFASYANDPAVVAYLKAQYAAQQAQQWAGGLPYLTPQGRPGNNTGGARAPR